MKITIFYFLNWECESSDTPNVIEIEKCNILLKIKFTCNAIISYIYYPLGIPNNYKCYRYIVTRVINVGLLWTKHVKVWPMKKRVPLTIFCNEAVLSFFRVSHVRLQHWKELMQLNIIIKFFMLLLCFCFNVHLFNFSKYFQ